MTSKFNLEDSAEIDFPQPSEETKPSAWVSKFYQIAAAATPNGMEGELEWEYLRLLFMLHSTSFKFIFQLENASKKHSLYHTIACECIVWSIGIVKHQSALTTIN